MEQYGVITKRNIDNYMKSCLVPIVISEICKLLKQNKTATISNRNVHVLSKMQSCTSVLENCFIGLHIHLLNDSSISTFKYFPKGIENACLRKIFTQEFITNCL